MTDLRDAADVWDDCYRAFYYGHTMSAITYPIEADRAAVEAATIAKVVAWLRVQQHGRTSDNYPGYYARRIEDGEWR